MSQVGGIKNLFQYRHKSHNIKAAELFGTSGCQQYGNNKPIQISRYGSVRKELRRLHFFEFVLRSPHMVQIGVHFKTFISFYFGEV